MEQEGKKRGPPDVSDMHTLKVDNITYRTSVEDLRTEFGRYGDIGDIYIPRRPGSTDARGYAFVRFRDLRDAEDAIRSLDGKEVCGREVRVQLARNKRPDDPKAQYHNNNKGHYNNNRGGRDRFDRGRDRSRDRSRRSRSGSRDRNYRGRDRDYGRDRNRDRDFNRDRDRDRERDRPERRRYPSRSRSRSRSGNRDNDRFENDRRRESRREENSGSEERRDEN